ncbi:MAG: glycosyltransferase, partial [Alphaproteobacteria bacterium]|nr:glycosyltransferase [Alphaproteobacteria bacterium]
MDNVLVLMSTYNGEKYLKTQLDSILAQQGVNVQILVRDDGSSDGTLPILQAYAAQGKLTYYTGPNLKPAKSFMDLIYNAPQADFYAFADQDDYWLPEKLICAVNKLKHPAYSQHA